MSDDALSSAPPADDGSGDDSKREVREARLQQVLDHVTRELATLRYGQLVITVQDGVVVQIDRTEKTRLR